jgi:hypothetical protein
MAELEVNGIARQENAARASARARLGGLVAPSTFNSADWEAASCRKPAKIRLYLLRTFAGMLAAPAITGSRSL